MWSLILFLLVLTRVHGYRNTEDANVMSHVATVHVVEFLAFAWEYFARGAKVTLPIVAIIGANAAWFTSIALRM